MFSYLTCSFQLKKKRHAHFELPKAISHFSPIFKVYHTILWAPYFNNFFGAARQTPCSPLLRVGTHSNVFYVEADVVLFLTQQNIGNWFGLVCVSWIRWYLLVRRFLFVLVWVWVWVCLCLVHHPARKFVECGFNLLYFCQVKVFMQENYLANWIQVRISMFLRRWYSLF